MCGFFISVGTNTVDIKKSTEIISHRGPDSDGYLEYSILDKKIFKGLGEIKKDNKPKVVFGFRRLSIIDLHSTSNQPFSDPSNNFHIVFNGEIYNYIELRNELKKIGHQFVTESDTEVLLHSYIEWGKNCLRRFNGMWSFCILDIRKEVLFCSRDRFGIKPFYYHQNNNGIVICSEIKQFFQNNFIKKNINENLIRDFLELSLVDHTNDTFYNGIKALPAAHYSEISLKNYNIINTIKYWELKPNNKYCKNTLEENTEIFKELFIDSIRLRHRSDVKVGACLSGGLDSSSIVSVSRYLNKITSTFTCTNSYPEFDESEYIDELIDLYPEIKNNSVEMKEEFLINDLDLLLSFQDEPITTFGVLAQWKVMELAKRNNITVLLDGQGGDEVLGGYRKYYAFYLKELFKQFKFVTFSKELYFLSTNKENNFFEKKGIKRYMNKLGVNKVLTDRCLNIKALSNIGISSASSFKEKSIHDIKYFSYPALLRYEDRNSMAFSIESRVPFLDYRIVDFLHSIPNNNILKNGVTKYILRKSLVGILPDKIRQRKSKLGYSTPETIWLNGSMRNYFGKYFNKMNNPYIDSYKVSRGFEGQKDYVLDPESYIRIYLFDRWYRINF
jgi:asparagine synthase (glutamine-hydrolysing)